VLDIAVVTPVLNGRRTLPDLVASLGTQGLRLQWVVVDDGSTDGSLRYLQDAALPQGTELVLARAERLGPGGARNVGLALVDAPWITFVDADDRLEPGALAAWVADAEQLDADLLVVDQPISIRGRVRARLGDQRRMLTASEVWRGELLRPWIANSKLYRHDLVRGMTFAESYEAEDLVFFVRAVLAAKRLAYAPGSPRYVYDGPSRSALVSALHDTEAVFNSYRDALEALAQRAPDGRSLRTGASPILGGLYVTLLRTLGHARTADEVTRLQALARDAVRCADLAPRRIGEICRRDRQIVALGYLCTVVAPLIARGLAVAWLGAKSAISFTDRSRSA